MGQKPKILVIEDNPQHYVPLQKLLVHSGYDVTVVSDLFQAEQELATNLPTYAAVTFDAWLPSGNETIPVSFTTFDLVQQTRARFEGRLIALSSNLNKELMRAGCTDQCSKKDDVVDLLLKLVPVNGGSRS